MKAIITIFASLFFSFCFSQETEIAIKKEEKDSLKFKIIEDIPVYKGCNKNGDKQSKQICANKKMARLVGKNFNLDIAQQTGIYGTIRIKIFFKIDTSGNVIDIKAEGPNESLKKEAERIAKLIPKFSKPGMIRGRPVVVPFCLPLSFKIDKPTKKEKQS